MNAAPNLKVVEPTPADPLLALREERDAIHKRLSEIAAQMPRLPPPDLTARDAIKSGISMLGAAELAAIEELDTSERNSMQAWLTAGAIGSPPSPDVERRAGLNQRLGEAMKLAATMRAATKDLTEEHVTLSAKLSTVNERISRSAVDAIARKFDAEYSSILKSAGEIRGRLALAQGAIDYLRGVAQEQQARGRVDTAAFIFSTLERLGQLPRLEFFPTREAMRDAPKVWPQALADLIG